MLDALDSACLSFALLIVVFTPLEKLFPARPQALLRPEWRIDLCFFLGQYLLFSAASITIILSFYRLFLADVTALLPGFITRQPMWFLLIVSVALGDFLVYWFHRACHHFPILWRFHAVHHSAERLDWLAAHREHPLDGLFTQFFQNLPALLLGARLELLAGLIVFRGAWGLFIHSNARLSIGPLRFLLGAPELHHWHHARVAPTRHNFANLAPWLDVLFGTYYRPPKEEEETYPLGLVDPWPRGYLAQLLRPFGIRWGKDLPPGYTHTA